MATNFTKLQLVQLGFYVLLFLSFNNKTFFPAVFLFWFYLFWSLKDWRQAAWLTLVAVLPFAWGFRDFKIDLSLPFLFKTYSNRNPFVYFPISAKFLISSFLLLTLAFKKRERNLLIEKKDIFLFAFLMILSISTLNSENMLVSLIGFSEIFQAILFYYLAKYFCQKKTFLLLTIYFLFNLAAFEGAMAGAQFFIKRPLGKIIEESLMGNPLGVRTAEDVFVFRSSGTFTDPITLAIFLSLLLPIILTQIVYKKPIIKINWLKMASFLLCFLGLMASFARGAWLISFLTFIILIFYLGKKDLLRKINKMTILFIIGLLIIFMPVVIPRLVSLKTMFWSKYNSGQSRIDLMEEALVIIRQNPLLGVGLGNFLPVMARNQVTEVATHFFFPVHNLYLLLASEVGVPATFLFLVFIYLAVKNFFVSRKFRDFSSLRVGLLASMLVYILSSFIYNRVWGVNMELFFLLLATVDQRVVRSE